DPHAASGEHHKRGRLVDNLAAYVTPLINAILGAGGASAVIVALLNRKPDLIKARSAADGATVEQWRQLYKEARAEFERLKAEAERIQSSYYGLLGLFVQFRNDVRTGVSDVIVALDKKDMDEAQAHAETLGRLV